MRKAKITYLKAMEVRALNFVRNQQREKITKLILKSSLKLKLTKIMRASTVMRHLLKKEKSHIKKRMGVSLLCSAFQMLLLRLCTSSTKKRTR